jgi:formaldehyde-activating enzyme involved in methanogenesis
MNNSVVLRQAAKMAQDLEQQWPNNTQQAIQSAFQRTMQRNPTAEELHEHQTLAAEHGLSQVCWVLLNSSEFLYMQ